jgi:hypothetical protein
MLDKITSTPKKVKNHVVKHRAKYAATATAVVALKLQMQTAKQFNAFLQEKGLYEEYYAIGQEF